MTSLVRPVLIFDLQRRKIRMQDTNTYLHTTTTTSTSPSTIESFGLHTPNETIFQPSYHKIPKNRSMSTIFRNLIHRIVPARRTVVVTTTLVGTTSLLCYLEYTTQIPSTKLRTSLLYHTMADQVVTPILRSPYFDPETAHHIAIYLAQHNLAPIYHPSAIEQRCTVGTALKFNNNNHNHTNNAHVRDLIVPHILGLAAGFDKDATIIQPTLQLGFGYTEVGTITLQPQPGNMERPRMFRLPSDFAIINRYGFNSLGVNVVKENLLEYRNRWQKSTNHTDDDKHDTHSKENYFIQLVRWFFPTPNCRNGVVGVNLGMNKDSGSNGDGNRVILDYTTLIQQLGPISDYLVINISSPNTPGLRDWQTNTDGLQTLLSACVKARNQLGDDVPPLFVKVAPDLTDDELIRIAQVCINCSIDGFVVANTTNQRPADLIHHHLATLEHGGLSGRPIRDRSTAVIRLLYKTTNGQIPIIGVGGISSGHDIYEKLRAGASLVQIYSHMIYFGPGSVSKLRKELAELLLLHGHRDVKDVVGLDHEEIAWEKRHEQLAIREQLEKHLYAADTLPIDDKTPATIENFEMNTRNVDEVNEDDCNGTGQSTGNNV